MVRDSWYRIENRDWVNTVEEDIPLTSNEVFDVLDQVSEFYPGAMINLADTEVPRLE